MEVTWERIPESGSRVGECFTPNGVEMARGSRGVDGVGGSEGTGWSCQICMFRQVKICFCGVQNILASYLSFL